MSKSWEFRNILKLAEKEATQRKSQIEKKDLLFGILKGGEGIPVRVIQEKNVYIHEMLKFIEGYTSIEIMS